MPNLLANESSPYLRQHAGNPVEWNPWGDSALARAKAEDVPILVSIGYSSCHWCHVMEHESFSDPVTAAYMNEHFVCIKVDREERPDIDDIYMEAVQAMTGHGGWPLTGFLTPAQVPIHMGTYYPPAPRRGMPSFMQVMESVAEAWATRREEIEGQSERIVEMLSSTGRLKAPPEPVAPDTLAQARDGIEAAYDPSYGGFGTTPKFPPPLAIDLLLAAGDEADREMAVSTLRAMARGGIHDQLAGGFARYSVDARWHVPHFEKMLYDNALLARAYLHGFQETGDAELHGVCRATLEWMLREMTGPDGAGGGFCSALDADSESPDGLTEGWFYSWDADEFRAVCGEHADDMCAHFGVTGSGELDGRNVLRVAAPERRPDEATFERLRASLLEERARRPRPFRDDKRIASWNALAIAALAEAGRVLGERRYVEAAVAAAAFVERELRKPDGSLRRSWLDGHPGPDGFLEDHAYVTAAWLTLYEATFDPRWFALARETAGLMIDRFADPDGGFFTTAAGAADLIVRRKDLEDNPIPSGNAAAAHALLRMAAFTGEDRYHEVAAGTLRMLQPMATRFPTGFAHALQAIQLLTDGIKELAIVGDPAPFVTIINSRYRPSTVLAGEGSGDPVGALFVAPTGSPDPSTTETVPLMKGRAPVDGKPTAFVCEQFVCRAPVVDADALADLLA